MRPALNAVFSLDEAYITTGTIFSLPIHFRIPLLRTWPSQHLTRAEICFAVVVNCGDVFPPVCRGLLRCSPFGCVRLQ
jgi:hypothetical protein